MDDTEIRYVRLAGSTHAGRMTIARVTRTANPITGGSEFTYELFDIHGCKQFDAYLTLEAYERLRACMHSMMFDFELAKDPFAIVDPSFGLNGPQESTPCGLDCLF